MIRWPWRRRPRPSAPGAVWTAGNRADDPAPAGPAGAAEPAGVTCDWRVVLTDATGTRSVRGREDACCTWTLDVRDLDPVPEPAVQERDELRWSGGDTCVRPGRATTPLHRETERRETSSAPDGVTAAWTWSRRPDEVVTTTGAGGPAPTVADGAHARAAAVWSHHLDTLRGRGARPDPVDGHGGHPSTRSLEVARRLAVELRSQTACAGVPGHADVVGTCEVELTTDRDGATTSPVTPRLAAWMEVDGTRVVADRPLGPVATDADLAWSRLAEGEGIAVTAVPTGAHTIRWRGAVDVSVPADDVTIVLGHAVGMSLLDGSGSSAQVHVHAATAARLRVAVDHPAPDACPCTDAHLVVEVGDGGVVLRVDGDEVPVTVG